MSKEKIKKQERTVLRRRKDIEKLTTLDIRKYYSIKTYTFILLIIKNQIVDVTALSLLQ